MIKYREGFIYIAGYGGELSWPGTTNGPTYFVHPFSYRETIPTMEGATCTINFSADDGPVLHVGVGDVSDTLSTPSPIHPGSLI